MKAKNIIVTAFLVFPFFAFCERIEADVSAWIAMGNGTTADGWEVKDIGGYSDGGAKFSRSSDYVQSPFYADIVTQIVMRVKSSSPTVVKILTVAPVDAEGASAHEVRPTSSGEKYEVEAFSWPASAGVRRFRIAESSGASGTWGVLSLTVYTGRIEPPAGLRDDPLYSDAFSAGWDAAARAVRYQVRYASVTRTPSQFETVAAWDFSTLTNTSGNTRYLKQLKDDNPGKLDGLSGEQVCMQGYGSGYIQIGTKDNLGRLVLPLPPGLESADDLTGVLLAWKHPDDVNKPTMPIFAIAGNETNDLASVELTGEKTECRFSMPEDFAADDIVLSSTTNGIGNREPHGRVRVERFAVVSGFVPETVSTGGFETAWARASERLIKNISPGEWIWSVRSFDAGGRDSPWSPFRTVVLDPKSPCRPRPGLCIRLR